MTADARDRFEQLVEAPEHEIDVAEAALWIAAEGRPDLDVAHYLSELEHIADAVRPAVEAAGTPVERIERLIQAFFVDCGFRGNEADYYDPRNSFLDEVIERRTGIPITLSIVFVEVARRLGLRADGVAFPGHFLTKIQCGDGNVVIDAFVGRALSAEECEERVRSTLGPDTRLEPGLLRAAGPKEILVRMLNNLKEIHLSRGELELALACYDRILVIVPSSAIDLRDRGIVYEKLQCYGPAAADLERFLELAPGDESAGAVRKLLASIRQKPVSIH